MSIPECDPTHAGDADPVAALVGGRLRELRCREGLSLRALADRSGLSVNTLSLVENGKSSPTVSTLQQLAATLKVPLAAFFECEPVEKRIVYTPAGQRPRMAFGKVGMQDLGKDLAGRAVQPFVVTLKPGAGSGERMTVHTGHEFVYCLAGTLRYQIDQEVYLLKAGDSLVFEAHLPHCWENTGEDGTQILLIFYPTDEREEPGSRHFSPATLLKELNMKIAVITEDGKTISQHFGRAPYFLVLTIEAGKIVDREMRAKLGHDQLHAHHHEGEGHGPHHGMDPGSHRKHASMAQAIEDCTAVVCGGMGRGAYESMRQLNIQPLVTDLRDIDAAAQAFIEGKLIDHPELLH